MSAMRITEVRRRSVRAAEKSVWIVWQDETHVGSSLLRIFEDNRAAYAFKERLYHEGIRGLRVQRYPLDKEEA